MKITPVFSSAFFDVAQQAKVPLKAPSHIVFNTNNYPGMTFDDFMKHDDFKNCQKEYASLIDKIIQVVRDGQACKGGPTEQTVAAVVLGFGMLKTNLSDTTADFFGPHKATVYGTGKQMFHDFAVLVVDNKISFNKRMDAIANMAPQMQVCSGGVLSVLRDGLAGLRASGAGLKGAAHRVMLQMIDAVISDHVNSEHKDPFNAGNEVHLVNAYFNGIAPLMKVTPRKDDFIGIGQSMISSDQMMSCKEKVLLKLKPGNVVAPMAEDYLSRIKSGLAYAELEGPFEGGSLTAAFTTVDNLAKTELDGEFGPVGKENYLLADFASDGLVYDVAKKPTRITRNFLQALGREGLIEGAVPIGLTKGTPDDGVIQRLGNLFWLEKEGECEEVEVTDFLKVSPQEIYATLRELSGVGEEDYAEALASVAWQVLDLCTSGKPTTSAGAIPEAWLMGFTGMSREPGLSAPKWLAPVMLLAVMAEREDALQALINAGADIHTPGEDGLSVIMVAAKNGCPCSMQTLIEAKVDLDAQDATGMTAMMHAAQEGHVDVLRVLVKGGANIELKNNEGFTAAMLAAAKGRGATLNVVIDAGADIEAEDMDGNTAVILAAEEGHVDAINILIEARANLHASTKKECYTAAMVAAERGHASALKILIKAGANVNDEDTDGYTATMNATRRGHVDVLMVLTEAGANIHAKTKQEGYTAALIAAGTGQVAALKVLIKAGANVNDEDFDGYTALMVGAQDGYVDVLDVLIEAGANIEAKTKQDGYTALMNVAKSGHVGAMKVLIQAGANIEAEDISGDTALLHAARDGYEDVLNVLIDGSANIEAKTKRDGYTAAMNAAKTGNVGILTALIKAGANIEAEDADGYTAALLAAQNGHADVLSVLIEAGANIEAEDINGFTAALHAAQNGHSDVLGVLIKAKANINAETKQDHFTPTMIAATAGFSDVLKVLIEAGADVNLVDVDGYTAAMISAQNGHIDSLNILIEAGANVNAETKEEGMTAMILAALDGHAEVLNVLIKAGANINAESTEYGLTTMIIAAQNGHVEALNIMIKAGANIDAKTKNDSYTAAMLAAEGGYAAALSLLIMAGADLEVENAQGFTAAKFAERFAADTNNFAIVNVLKEALSKRVGGRHIQ